MQPRQASTTGIGAERVVTIAGTTLLSLLWLTAIGAIGAVGLEFLLRARSHWDANTEDSLGPVFNRLDQAYAQASVEHLHPQYFSFFPFDPHERIAISNETCSLDADGFRGPGPAHAGGRRLAFLLGGSTAFG